MASMTSMRHFFGHVLSECLLIEKWLCSTILLIATFDAFDVFYITAVFPDNVLIEAEIVEKEILF